MGRPPAPPVLLSPVSGTDPLSRALQATANAVPELMWLVDAQGRCLFLNEAAARYLGEPAETLMGRSLLGRTFAGQAFPVTAQDLLNGAARRQIRALDAQGHEQVLELEVTVLDAGQPDDSATRLCVGRYITDLVEQSGQIRQGETLLRQVVQSAPLIIWMTDAAGRIVLNTGMGLQAFGLKDQSRIGQQVFDVFADDPDAMDQVRQILSDGQPRTWESCVRGGIRHRNHGSALFNERGDITGGLCISIDITERYEQEVRLRELAYVSQITDLPNRARLVEWLADMPPGSALIHFDLDHFRRINESFGRITGNGLIKAAAMRLRASLPADVRLSHLGGDHFAALTPLTTPEQAERITKKALGVFRDSLTLEQGHFFCTLSAGIALRQSGESPDDWLNHAEIALHRAKDDGRNRCLLFRSEFIDHVREDTRIYLEIRKALDLNLLRVHYEPQIGLQNRRVVGFEALTRWHHPPLAGVSVADTIRVAEESGLIREITRLVMEQVCADLQNWRVRLGPRLPCVSINVNADEFVDPSFLTLVDETLGRDSGIAPFLRIELTESAMMASPAEARRVLQALRQRGVMASLDDFGTGFSSLSLLHELPVDEIKIDRSLVPGPSNPVPSSLVRTIMAMASLLRLRTTVEGIETREQEKLMTTLGCDHAQGFLYSRALSANDACDIAAAYPSPFSDHLKGSP